MMERFWFFWALSIPLSDGAGDCYCIFMCTQIVLNSGEIKRKSFIVPYVFDQICG